MDALRIRALLVALGIRLRQVRKELALRRRVYVRLDMVALTTMQTAWFVWWATTRRNQETQTVLLVVPVNTCLRLTTILRPALVKIVVQGIRT